MRRVTFALVCLLIVLAAAILRPKASPATHALPTAPRGVVLIAVEGLGLREADVIFRRAQFTGYGLMPTRNGTADDGDFDAGLRMILSGTRNPAPDTPDLVEVRRQYAANFEVLPFRGAGAVLKAANTIAALSAPSAKPEGTAVIVVGVTPSVPELRLRARVAPVFYWVPRSETPTPFLLTSPSTRHRPGLIAATDIAATVAALVALPQTARRIGDGRPMEGTPIGDGGGSQSLDTHHPAVDSLRRQADGWALQAREQKLMTAIPWCLAALFLGAYFAPNERIRAGLRTAMLSTPLALILTAGLLPLHDVAYLIYPVAALPVLIMSILGASGARWSLRLPRFIAVATAVTIAMDTCLGNYLLTRTPLSYSVLEAARFYGVGNEISGLFLGAALVAVGANSGPFPTVCWGLATAILLGAPALGADAGGFIAALIGFTTLFVVGQKNDSVPSRRMKKIVIPVCITLLIALVGIALWDGSRPSSSRTHVGQAVSLAREKGIGSIVTIAERKLRVNARLLTSSPWAVLLAVEVGLLIWAHHRRKRRGQDSLAPASEDLRTAMVVATFALFVLNDSGVVAGATCGIWLLAIRGLEPPPDHYQDVVTDDSDQLRTPNQKRYPAIS